MFVIMYKAYKYRLYPTAPQKQLIHKHCGSVRFLYNLALETKITVYSCSGVNLSRYDLQQQLVELKKELPWLKEINSQSLQSSLINLDAAYKNFFSGAGYPKFKTARNKKSFYIPQSVKIKYGRLFIPKFKNGIKLVQHRPIKGDIKSATISVTTTGKYYVSILCDTGKNCKTKPAIIENTAIGIDLGIKHFAVTSDNEVITNPKFLKDSINRLKVLQRRASKKQKGSKNRKKANKRVALLHERVKNQRQDFLHKLSSRLVSENQTICLEDLAVSNMMRNHKLAQAISDVSWYEFNRMIEYKAKWHGVNLLRIGRFTPSSKTCECGEVNKNLKLSDRVWKCESCGSVNERDLLAAQNIKKFALKDYSGQGLPVEPVEMSTLVESEKQEVLDKYIPPFP